MRRQDVWVVSLFLSILLTSNYSHAQLIRGFVSGTITDSAGAVVPCVQVTLTNTLTSISRQTQTNALGFYRFVAVEPGEYAVQFAFPGFETRRLENILVRTTQEIVLDQTLTVGGVAAELS